MVLHSVKEMCAYNNINPFLMKLSSHPKILVLREEIGRNTFSDFYPLSCDIFHCLIIFFKLMKYFLGIHH